jgi:microcystin-dependent protein
LANPFLGEIRIFAFNFAPTGWAQCNGQLLSISQNTALFSLLGTYYGGDGKTNFALPEFRGRVPINMGQKPGFSLYDIGEAGGTENVALNLAELPAHTHLVQANSSSPGGTDDPNGAFPANTAAANGNNFSNNSNENMSPQMVLPSGGGSPHANIQPTLALNFCIAEQGVFPPRS